MSEWPDQSRAANPADASNPPPEITTIHWDIDVEQYSHGAARVVRRIVLGVEPAIVVSPHPSDDDVVHCSVSVSGDMSLEAAAEYLIALGRAMKKGLQLGTLTDGGGHLEAEGETA